MNIQALSTITSCVVVLAFLLWASEARLMLGATYLLIGLAQLLALFVVVKLSNERIVDVLQFDPAANIVRFGFLGACLGFLFAGSIVCVAAGMRRSRGRS